MSIFTNPSFNTPLPPSRTAINHKMPHQEGGCQLIFGKYHPTLAGHCCQLPAASGCKWCFKHRNKADRVKWDKPPEK